MKTFLNIYVVVQAIALVIWFYTMICIKPTWNEGKNRFQSNWKEGGHIGLIIFIVIAFLLSCVITKTYLLLNFLEK
jgi:hypothetical protein